MPDLNTMSESRNSLRLLIIIEHRELPSSRIRYVQVGPYLEALGIQVDIVEYPEDRKSLFRLLFRMRRVDLVLLQKRLPNPPESLLFRLFAKLLVYDYDDAVRMRHLPRNGSYRSRSREVRFDTMIALADAVICGNEYLAGLMQRKKRVHIYPSPVPTEVPQKEYGQAEGTLKIGWIGLGTNLNSLERIIPDLQRLAAEMRFELVIISNRGLEIDGVSVVNCAWSLEEQEKRIAELDIGLMPLDSTSPFDKGKCSYKLLQYMASGVIPVADAVGMNETVIRDAENGRLVYDGDWYPILKELGEQGPGGRAELGKKARQTVLETFDYAGQAERLSRFLQQVACLSQKSRDV